MKTMRRKACQLLAFILIISPALLSITTSASAVEYDYIELPQQFLIGPNLSGSMTGINDSNAVVGAWFDGATYKGLLYSEGVYTYIMPPGSIYSYAVDINENGAVVGSGRSDGSNTKGFLYNEGEYTDIIPPEWSRSSASRINDSGSVVGFGGKGTGGFAKGFLYSEGIYTDIIPPGWIHSIATDINDSGAVVGFGSESIDSDSKGFLYSEGIYTDIIPPGAILSFAYGINDNGAVVGYGYDGTTYKGFLYSEGIYTDIIPPGATEAFALAINDSGDVVGHWYDGTTTKGFLYSKGVYTNIIPPEATEAEAWGINNSGMVVGTAEGSFIAFPNTTPSEKIQTIMGFFNFGVANGNLKGIGIIKLFAAYKLKAFRNMLVQAQDLIENRDTEAACNKLKNLYKKIDGKPWPPDFIGGSAASDLAAKIDALIKSMNCS